MEIYEIIIILTFLISFYLTLVSKKRSQLPLFTYFIACVFIFEIFVEYYLSKIFKNNIIGYNIFSRFCNYYYLYVFLQFYRKQSWVNTYYIIVITYIIWSIVYLIINIHVLEFDVVSYNVGMIILLPVLLKYLFDVIYKRDYYNIYSDSYIYLSFGLLLFYSADFTILQFLNILVTENVDYSRYVNLLDLGNIFLSLGYLGAVVCIKHLK